MGNTVCFQSSPTDLKTFCESLKTSPPKSGSLARTSSPTPLATPRDARHHHLILLWEFSAERKTNLCATPIKITEFDYFKPNRSYLLLHLYPTNSFSNPSSPADFPRLPQKTQSFGSIENQKRNSEILRTLCRGTKATFVDHQLYLWNGSEVGGFLKALSFSKSCELRSSLSQTSNVVLQNIFFSQNII